MEGHEGRVDRSGGVGRPALASGGAGCEQKADLADRDLGSAAEAVDEAFQPTIGAARRQKGAAEGGRVVQQPLRSGHRRSGPHIEALDHRSGGVAHEAFARPGVGRHKDPQSKLGDRDQPGPEVQRAPVAAVAEVAAGQRVFEHSVVPRTHARGGLQQGRAEVLCDGGAVDGAAVQRPVAQDRHHVARHVRTRGRAGLGGAVLGGELRRLGRQARAGPAEALGDVARQLGLHRRGQAARGRIGLAKGGAGQAERLEDLALGQGLRRLAGHLTQGFPGEGRGVGRVGRQLAGFAYAPGTLLGEIGLQRPDQGGIGLDDLAEAPLLEARALAHQVLQPHRLHEALLRCLVALAQVLIDRRVQAHVPSLDLVQHADPGEGLGDRPEPEQGARGIDWADGREAVDAIALVEQHLAVLDHRHHRAGNVIAAHGLGGETVDEGFEFGGGQGLAGRQPHARLRRWRRRHRGRDLGGMMVRGDVMQRGARRPDWAGAHQGDRRQSGRQAAPSPRHARPPACPLGEFYGVRPAFESTGAPAAKSWLNG